MIDSLMVRHLPLRINDLGSVCEREREKEQKPWVYKHLIGVIFVHLFDFDELHKKWCTFLKVFNSSFKSIISCLWYQQADPHEPQINGTPLSHLLFFYHKNRK